MLTRLQVSGFKNLVDVDVRFGPFTCIAGPNGAGKSNLFDAIHFLSLLAERSLLEAAFRVRDEEGRLGDIRNLFHRVGDDYADVMSFDAEMIIPSRGQDVLGQDAQATATFLRYELKLAYRGEPQPGLEIQYEGLRHIRLGDAPDHLRFPHKAASWRRAAVTAKNRGAAFLSTNDTSEGRIIQTHQDGGSRGGPVKRSAASLTRTVLSAAYAAEAPTVALAKKEMLSWRRLQLEPSRLRRPDGFTSATSIGPDGSCLAATLYRLAQTNGEPTEAKANPEQIYATIANRLSELVEAVRGVSVDRDDKRELLTLQMTDQEGTTLPTMSLSDGTLRFLALAVLEMDPLSQGVICLEEPENGIHPERIPAMLRLLQDIATDPKEAVGPDNPLRQVVINTHSPVVAGAIPKEDLLLAELREVVGVDNRFKAASFLPLPDTWRAKIKDAGCAAKGKVQAFLNPLANSPEVASQDTPKKKRVADWADRDPKLPFDAL